MNVYCINSQGKYSCSINLFEQLQNIGTAVFYLNTIYSSVEGYRGQGWYFFNLEYNKVIGPFKDAFEAQETLEQFLNNPIEGEGQ